MAAKVITVCGSLKFQDEMMRQSDLLERAGNCVLSVVYPSQALDLYTPEDNERFAALHFQKIRMSDGIFVVNVGGYVGESTRKEMAYARKLGKEILSLEPILGDQDEREHDDECV